MTSAATLAAPTQQRAERIVVRGLVQGVGFRPTVWRLATRHGLRGWVANDGQGVTMQVCGDADELDAFAIALTREAPPLARVEQVERLPVAGLPTDMSFVILASSQARANTTAHTGVVPDAATCTACTQEVLDPFSRRYRYPFTNCTHCGPRLSIIDGIPYDRAATTMRGFTMCAACEAEYQNPADRRFHAQPIACHACGPRVRLERADRAPFVQDAMTMLDAVDAICTVVHRGLIAAIKGVGGYQLACDATQEAAVARLRERKARERKPLALMVRDLDVLRRYCHVSAEEEALLTSPAAPIVILDRLAEPPAKHAIAPSVAPGIHTLGVMLPNTPLHHLMLRRMERPIVLTSGNLSDEPQCIADDDAGARLSGIADYLALHDRPITRRVDDSVQRITAHGVQTLRRARGLAPAPLALPPGFEAAPPLLALGGELKNTFCLLREGQAIMSHHLGDLENAATFADAARAIDDYLTLFDHAPLAVVIDKHPEYLSAKHGRELAEQRGLPLLGVQHHHAHIAACLAENGAPLNAPPVIGVALDGLGYGDDGTLWGGEFLLADYRVSRRLATFKPVPLPGGAMAMREPWRNTYAHLMMEMGWARFSMNYDALDLHAFLQSRPLALIDSMLDMAPRPAEPAVPRGDLISPAKPDLLRRAVNCPPASSCGRLFDAVAAAAGVCRERVAYEGQAAMELEALADAATLADDDDESSYPFAIPRLQATGMPYIEPLAMWQALLGDLVLGTPVPVISARFHKGLAIAVCAMVDKLSRHESPNEPIRTVALSGGVFQNRVLLDLVHARLAAMGFRVLTHHHIPANDGGISLGQAVIAAAQALPQPSPL